MSHTSYNDLPYTTLAQRTADPIRLAAIGRLYGIDVPSPDNSRILEIGSGTGENLIHIAERFPHSRCVGVDISEKQIEIARKIAAKIGLNNIEFIHADIQRDGVIFGKFDIIICHGVYSWVAPHVQHKLLTLISSSLTENGLAYVSYNVLPGWRQRGAVRDVMLSGARFKSAATGSYAPNDRLAGALELLSVVSEHRSGKGDLYSSYINESQQRFQYSDPAYLFHEYLEEHNSAVLFTDFMELAALHGLQFVSEAKPATMSSDDLSDKAKAYLERFAEDVVASEQCLDLIRNRMFRETILCRAELTLKRDLKASVFKSLFFVSDLRFVKEANSSAEFLGINEEVPIVVPLGQHVNVLRIIGENSFCGISFDGLVKKLVEEGNPNVDARELMHTLVGLWRTGFVDVSIASLSIVKLGEDGIGVSRLAHYQAENKYASVTALPHRSYPLCDLEREVLLVASRLVSINAVRQELQSSYPLEQVGQAIERLVRLGFFYQI